jgi:hypothetical protein
LGAPLPEMEPVENASAEALLDSLKTIDPGERRKHASVFNYWLSIRGGRQFPPIRDLDPLEISDAGPWSVLLEMIGGGEDAIVRHFGQAIKAGIEVEKVGDAPNPSLLACIHAKLPIVAACREAFAFEEAFETDQGPRRCWVTLLPFSQTGTWIDFVYGYVSLDGAEVAAAEIAEVVEDEPEDDEAAGPQIAEFAEEPEPEDVDVQAEEGEPQPEPEPFQVELKPYDEEAEATEAPAPVVEMVPEPVEEAPAPEPLAEIEPEPQPEAEPVDDLVEPTAVDEPEPESEPEREPAASKAGFSSKFLEGLASSFYGKVNQAAAPAEDRAEPEFATAAEPEMVVAADDQIEPVSEPAYAVEGTLQNKLTDVRALAAEAREAQVRSNMALYEGLSAAYDFALDAEDAPEEYLRLVEGQGLKIQLRSPMKPVVKLAFDGMCDEPTIKQLEAVLAWALKHDLPRGTLADRIQAEGGLGPILNGTAA